MTIITNRPKPPRQLFRGKFYPVHFDSWDYLSDLPPGAGYPYPQSNHSMRLSFHQVNQAWQRTVSIVGSSGVCSELVISAKNNDLGNAHLMGVRVYIDGESAFSEEVIEVLANRVIGFSLIGKFIFYGNAFRDTISMPTPFHNSFVVETYSGDSTQLEVMVARRLYWTS